MSLVLYTRTVLCRRLRCCSLTEACVALLAASAGAAATRPLERRERGPDKERGAAPFGVLAVTLCVGACAGAALAASCRRRRRCRKGPSITLTSSRRPRRYVVRHRRGKGGSLVRASDDSTREKNVAPGRRPAAGLGHGRSGAKRPRRCCRCCIVRAPRQRGGAGCARCRFGSIQIPPRSSAALALLLPGDIRCSSYCC